MGPCASERHRDVCQAHSVFRDPDSVVSGTRWAGEPAGIILDDITLVARAAAISDAESTLVLVRALLSGLATALYHPSFVAEKR